MPILALTGSSVIAGLAGFGTILGLQHVLGTQGLIIQLLQLCISGLVGLLVFVLLALLMKIPEVNTFFLGMGRRLKLLRGNK